MIWLREKLYQDECRYRGIKYLVQFALMVTQTRASSFTSFTRRKAKEGPRLRDNRSSRAEIYRSRFFLGHLLFSSDHSALFPPFLVVTYTSPPRDADLPSSECNGTCSTSSKKCRARWRGSRPRPPAKTGHSKPVDINSIQFNIAFFSIIGKVGLTHTSSPRSC